MVGREGWAGRLPRCPKRGEHRGRQHQLELYRSRCFLWWQRGCVHQGCPGPRPQVSAADMIL